MYSGFSLSVRAIHYELMGLIDYQFPAHRYSPFFGPEECSYRTPSYISAKPCDECPCLESPGDERRGQLPRQAYSNLFFAVSLSDPVFLVALIILPLAPEPQLHYNSLSSSRWRTSLPAPAMPLFQASFLLYTCHGPRLAGSISNTCTRPTSTGAA